MVKRFLRFFAYLAFFVVALIFFAPKLGMYYFLENELKAYDVIISGETLKDEGVSLNIKDGQIFVKSIESASIEECDVTLLLFYNAINATEITLSQSAKSFVPLKVQELKLSYTLFNPLHIKAYAVGEFGSAQAQVNILDRTIHVDLQASEMMSKGYKNSLREFKKSEDGGFTYDKTF
ncbi:hypothetical protein KKG77_03115 [bacterium]|nr:hypothetical protein [bacterium]